ncbi:hypothetical protein [Ekhidna sp.]|jgi:hypothetical protein|uniref:hypothetical protein n=1 Tax=Ekhidna sp. TaxID=2608089 RepID=UPI0032EEAFA5
MEDYFEMSNKLSKRLSGSYEVYATISEFDLNQVDRKKFKNQISLLKQDLVAKGNITKVKVVAGENGWQILEGLEIVLAVEDLIKKNLFRPDYQIEIQVIDSQNVDSKKILLSPAKLIADADQRYWPIYSTEHLFQINPIYTPHYKLMPLDEQIQLHLNILDKDIVGVYVYLLQGRNVVNSCGFDTNSFQSFVFGFNEIQSWKSEGCTIVYTLIEKTSDYRHFEHFLKDYYRREIPVYDSNEFSHSFLLSNSTKVFSIYEFVHYVHNVDFHFNGAQSIKGVLTITKLGIEEQTEMFGFKGREEQLIKDLPFLLELYKMEDQSDYLISITPGSKDFQLFSHKQNYLRFKWYMDQIMDMNEVTSDDIIRSATEAELQF